MWHFIHHSIFVYFPGWFLGVRAPWCHS